MKNKVNEIKLKYIGGYKLSDYQKISCSFDAAEIAFEQWDLDTIEAYESFKIILLNNHNGVKGIHQISQGCIASTSVDLRILFAVVLKSLATAIILIHNHPSGNLKASKVDIDLTHRVKKAAELFDVKVLDHLILCPNRKYFSFADEGLM